MSQPKTKQIRRKFGLSGAPLDKQFDGCHSYFRDEVDNKILATIVKSYLKSVLTPEEFKRVSALSEYHFFLNPSYAAAIHWMNNGLELPDKYSRYPVRIKEYFLEASKNHIDVVEDVIKAGIVKKSPTQLIFEKVNSSIMVDIDRMEDSWFIGDKTDTVDVFDSFQKHDLKGSAAIKYVESRIQSMLDEYTDCLSGSCEQAVEAWGHLTSRELKRRIKVLDGMLVDVEKLKAVVKTTRKSKVITKVKAKPVIKQVENLLFLKEDMVDYKLKSINPVLVPGSMRLFTFNVKTRTLFEFITTSTKGLEIRGSTIQNHDPSLSRSMRLRKPDEILPIIGKASISKINKLISEKVTTKITFGIPGRINRDMILLRTL